VRRSTAAPVDEKCAGVSRHAFWNGGACDDVLRRAGSKDCSTFPTAKFADRRTQRTNKVLRQQRKRCASQESPLEISPVDRIQAQREGNVRRKKEEAGAWVWKEETRRVSAAEFRLEQVDDGVLLGDHLGLPDEGDSHQAHGKDTEGKRQAHLCF